MSMNRRTNEEWLELYNQQRASGMTVKDWCAAKEIKLPTMADRITRLRKMGLIKEPKPVRGNNSTTGTKKETQGKNKKQKSQWMPVDIPAASEVTGGHAWLPLTEDSPGNIEIQVGACIIRVNMPLEGVIQVVGRCFP